MTPPSLPTPVVVVWRNTWLARSETFIANQVSALARWKSVHVGRVRLDAGLPIRLDLLLPSPGRLASWADRRFGWSPTQARFSRFLKQTGATLLHVHFGTSATTALPYAQRNGLPLIVTFHGFDVGLRVDGEDEWAVRRRTALERVFAYATLLVAVSDFIGQRLRRLGAPEEKIVVQRIGIPHRPFPALSQERLGVIFVGRLVPKKGVDDLLRAFALLGEDLRRQHPLTIVGDGPERPSLQKLAAELGLGPSWLLWKSPAEVESLVEGAAVFCGPSKTSPEGDVEGLGMVSLEAQSRGTPVVAYRHGGVPEAIDEGRTGLLADEGDVVGLAGSLKTLLESTSLRAEMGTQGASWVREHYDIVKQTAGLEALYDRAVIARAATRERKNHVG